MPIREITCNDCKHSGEIILKMNKDAQCPKCKSYKVEIKISTPAPPKFEDV